MHILFLELLVFVGLSSLIYWAITNDVFAAPEVRRLRKMKRALKAQLEAKKEVLRLRRELGDLQAQLDEQETKEMARLEDMISSLGKGERPRFGDEDLGGDDDDGEPPKREGQPEG